MTQSQPFSCALIGGDSLLIECGELLLARGHRIRAVLTAAPAVRAWAARKELPTLAPDARCEAELARESFDYLFSITHLALIPDSLLALPRKGAINFHDGPLPRYAGLNTPVWALIHGEEEHGISWHRIEGGVDEGPLLLQKRFAIQPGETALSLNTRCFEAGLDSFAELVDQLATGSERAEPQDLSLRRYFGRHDRPDASAVLDWSRSAMELEALIRALDHGRYPNPLSRPKVAHQRRVLCVGRTHILEASGKPGELLALDADGWSIATGEGGLLCSEWSELDGTALTPEQAAQALGIRVGEVLQGPSPAERAALTSLEARHSRRDAAWTRRLTRLEAPTLPWPVPEVASGLPDFVAAPLPLPENCAALDAEARADALLGAFGLALARLCGRHDLTLGFAHDEFDAALSGALPVFSSRGLISLPVDPKTSFEGLRAVVSAARARALAEGCWPLDLHARQPELHGRPFPFGPDGIGVTVAWSSSPADYTPSEHDRITLALGGTGETPQLYVDRARVSSAALERLQSSVTNLLRNLAAKPQAPVGAADLLDEAELRKILVDWNATETPLPGGVCVHEQILAQVDRTPEHAALVCGDEGISYAELERRSARLAAQLAALGAAPNTLVGIYLERSIDLVVAVLGVLRAGAAYVPLDPAFPAERVSFMAADAKLRLVVTHSALKARLSLPPEAAFIEIDAPPAKAAPAPAQRAAPENLAYVIYTSGSTGQPKGVMVEHRNVVNFFSGMDARIPHDPPGRWLAVTSLSFDISVLELLWTLTRGFEVVIHRDTKHDAGPATKRIEFGLFLWGNDAGPGARKYELMLAAARYGDTHGFSSIWTPERHFHAFGGPFPNPSVSSAAIAAVTERIRIRAGSCVSPLHHPIRIAEEWAMVDNLSNGRVGISFASGWQPDDFVLRPENFAENKAQMLRDVELVRRLWRGEAVEFPGPKGVVAHATLPRPVQPELPVWITSAGNPETYAMAGKAGANVLTHLLGQSVKEVAEKIRIYREARAEAGLDPAGGVVTLMLHTFIGDDIDRIRETVREPMKRYLASATNLVKKYAWSFPAFKRPDAPAADLDALDLDSLAPAEWDAMMEHAFQRYFESSGLFGTPESVQPKIEELKSIGVDEIGCLIDYGLPVETTLAHLEPLNRARQLANPAAAENSGRSLSEQVKRRRVSHLQCTPSMARLLLLDDENRGAFSDLEQVLIGGESFPPALARGLAAVSSASITNLYGPTETTIWSATHSVDPRAESVPIGRPIANTQLYVLDAQRRPLPPGVAGDLYIGGAGVVRGYLERPELTAERFMPNPFRAGERIYATGDLARFRSDGVLEFLGRSDHQVKIRGHRIELGEIEARLGEHPQVRECVVVAGTDPSGEPRLVAYLTAVGTPPDSASLRQHLRALLPESMIPSHVVTLDELPLTPNAKVDRKALPTPEAVRNTARPATAAEVAPSGELQTRIAACWRQVLGLERVGVRENFFDIGGHSLLVVRLQRILKDAIDQPLSLTDLYRFPTIQSLAEWLESDGEDAALARSADRAQQRRASLQRKRSRGPQS